MHNRKIIDTLKALLRQRGKVSREQMHYAMVEERALMQLCPAVRPSDEVRFSHLRTLKSYIGEHQFRLYAKS